MATFPLTRRLGLPSVPTDSLKSALQSNVVDVTRLEIAFRLWSHRVPSKSCPINAEDLRNYFQYYTEQSDYFEPGRHTWAETHEDVIQVSDLMQQGLTRTEVKGKLRDKLDPVSSTAIGDEMLETSIDLTIRLLLMIKVGELSDCFAAYKSLQWEEGPSIRQFVTASFEPRRMMINDRVKLDKIFNARNLERIAGMKIVWTDNLADHLRVLDEDSEIAIFHHVTFLEAMQHSDLFPRELINETLRTLALLFPPTDETKQWFKKVSLKENLDQRLITCGILRAEQRQIDEFHYWRDQLVILKQIFDEKEPNTWLQWWHDKRRGLHRYPFLLAATALALTIVVGIVQCVEGAIQVYKAFRPE